MNVAKYIVEFLIAHQVKHIFGFQGGAIMKIIHEAMATGKLDYIQNYHEQASAFAADAYARIDYNIAVAVATSGPGATNLINGIANAYMDSIPTLFITGQDYTYNLKDMSKVRQSGFQALNIVDMVKPVTKYATLIDKPQDIKYELEKALYIAKSGRPGPVLLDIPIDVQFAELDNIKFLKSYTPPSIEPFQIEKISEIIPLFKKAKRPVILAGGGVQLANTSKQLQELTQITNIPVVTTLNGIDACKNAYSFSGLHGNTYANLMIYNADLILILGARLGLRQISKNPETYTKNAKIIHIDIDKVELGRKLPTELGIYCDLPEFFTTILPLLNKTKLPNYNQWHEQSKQWKINYENNTHLNLQGLDPVKFIKKMNDFLEEKAIITCDVGQHQMWAAQGIKIKNNQRMLHSSGFGSMGYALPAAIGAKYASPQSQVLAITGDGGFQMNMQELMLIAQQKLNIKCIVFNNNTLGMMREVQERYYNAKYYGASPQDFACVNLKLLAKTYDIEYLQINSLEQINKLKTLLQSQNPALIEIKINIDAKLLNKYDEVAVFEENTLDG